MERDVIIACDFKSAEDTFRFLDLFRDEERKPFLKIGMELFYAEGPEIVREIKRREHRIFLDLKLHDIPNTVRKAMAVLSRLDVDMCNVHAAGTIEMMKAAREGLTREDGTRPLLIAVTQLTSTSEERMQRELLIGASINETIVKYAANAREAAVKRLLEGRVAAVRDIAATCYTFGEGERLTAKMRDLALSPSVLADVVDMADLYSDRAVTRLREQLPGWTARNYDFAALVIAGFSPQEICVMLDMSLNGVYTLKSKLKRRIAESGAADRERLLGYFS